MCACAYLYATLNVSFYVHVHASCYLVSSDGCVEFRIGQDFPTDFFGVFLESGTGLFYAGKVVVVIVFASGNGGNGDEATFLLLALLLQQQLTLQLICGSGLGGFFRRQTPSLVDGQLAQSGGAEISRYI